ncbi:MAG: glycosyltransferase family 1 protein [Calditrichaeota bacterium]|nr:MAG: glycosyltransferase family 1 protein [Calditrichota bacterium]
MVDKYYFIKGGAERYFFELKKLLTAHGHEVIPFSMKHRLNFASPYESYFVDNIEFNHLSSYQKVVQAPKIVGRVIYSREAKKAVSRLIEEVKPDLAHLHMIDHQLSPSILHAFQEYGIPVIQTCHQYKHVCPSYRLFVMHKNRICEKCLPGKFYHAVTERCHKNSIGASALVAIESYLHKWMKIYDGVHIFHVPSRFLGQKLVQGGFPPEKIWHCFYTLNLEDYPFHPHSENYFVYYGRLSEEKGILTLLKAMRSVSRARLKIIGDGPQRPILENFVRKHHLQHVEFLGNRGGQELVSLVQNARFVVVPSEWYDNSPLVIYEAFSMGKPVIASTLGGMPELVDHEVNGYHFEAKNVQQLAERIRQLWEHPKRCREMGEQARQKAEAEFSPEAHYEKIMSVYQQLLGKTSPAAVRSAEV